MPITEDFLAKILFSYIEEDDCWSNSYSAFSFKYYTDEESEESGWHCCLLHGDGFDGSEDFICHVNTRGAVLDLLAALGVNTKGSA